MPVQVSYPGVYIEEIPSGVRTITGVATSITAFIGRALKGAINDPITINSYGDYERLFGGLWIESTMSYAVRDFFLNGGSQAIIIRIHNNATRATIDLPTDNSTLTLRATSLGAWANSISVAVGHNVANPMGGSADPNAFNLHIFVDGVKIEEHLNVSWEESQARYVPRVLQQSSGLLEIAEDSLGSGTWTIPESRPDKIAITTPSAMTGGADGDALNTAAYQGVESNQTGLYALYKTDLFNLLCITPPTRRADTDVNVYSQALSICQNKRAMLLVDPPFTWGTSPSSATAVSNVITDLSSLGLAGTDARNAVLYFPRILQSDPNRDNQIDTFVPCGVIAGIISKTDTNRGIWKSPAGIDAALNNVRGLQVNLSDPENGQLNPLGVNCLRNLSGIGRVVWGARTLRGADILADEYKYIAPRRTALFIEESLYRGLKWVVFEPNDEPLWAQIRLNVGAFMHNLFRQGAFQGKKKEAYFVKCDSETTTQNDINLGIVNILVGFAPLKPAEFVIIKLQQIAGEIEV